MIDAKLSVFYSEHCKVRKKIFFFIYHVEIPKWKFSSPPSAWHIAAGCTRSVHCSVNIMQNFTALKLNKWELNCWWFGAVVFFIRKCWFYLVFIFIFEILLTILSWARGRIKKAWAIFLYSFYFAFYWFFLIGNEFLSLKEKYEKEIECIYNI